MKRYLKQKNIRKEVIDEAQQFYRSNKNVLNHELYSFEDFTQELFLKMLGVVADKDLFTRGFLMLTIYSKMKSILTCVIEKTTIEAEEINLSYMKTFSVNDCPHLNYLKDLIEEQLSFKQAFIIINRIFNEFTYEDIAKELGCTKQNVYYHYKEGLRLLELKLEDFKNG